MLRKNYTRDSHGVLFGNKIESQLDLNYGTIDESECEVMFLNRFNNTSFENYDASTGYYTLYTGYCLMGQDIVNSWSTISEEPLVELTTGEFITTAVFLLKRTVSTVVNKCTIVLVCYWFYFLLSIFSGTAQS
jgi:hypothetical protein